MLHVMAHTFTQAKLLIHDALCAYYVTRTEHMITTSPRVSCEVLHSAILRTMDVRIRSVCVCATRRVISCRGLDFAFINNQKRTKTQTHTAGVRPKSIRISHRYRETETTYREVAIFSGQCRRAHRERYVITAF